ncbi:hypothetical protein JCM33374_g2742 [Metschnikowia sp. JCM 33374]|nr:hypothetical protein JCM33374_g2742 [Metschnikowia sp. JCM 33374]
MEHGDSLYGGWIRTVFLLQPSSNGSGFKPSGVDVTRRSQLSVTIKAHHNPKGDMVRAIQNNDSLKRQPLLVEGQWGP